MSDRLNWYSETGPERRARRHGRIHAAQIWIAIAAVVLAVLLWMGGPFSAGSRCSTSTRTDAATGYQTVKMECHQVHSWRP